MARVVGPLPVLIGLSTREFQSGIATYAASKSVPTQASRLSVVKAIAPQRAKPVSQR